MKKLVNRSNQVIHFITVIMCILSMCFTSLPQVAAQAISLPAQDQGKNKISLDIKGMDIVDVLKLISNRTGINMVIGRNVTGRITLFLKDVDIWDAFEIILSASDLAYERKGDIINIMTQRDFELQFGERYQDKKQAKILQLKYAKAADLSRALNQIKSNIGRIVVDESSNTLVLIDSSDKIAAMESFIQNTDLPIQTCVFSLNYAQADKLQPKLQEVITKGVGSVRIDERTNQIVVNDFHDKMIEISKLVKEFDEKTPQVLIDAQIIEITPQKDEFSMGVDWDYFLKDKVRLIAPLPAPGLPSATTIGAKLAFGVAASALTNTVSSTGQYKSIVDMLRVIGETKILSSPRIMALNNQEAKILVGTKDAYITSTTSQASGAATVTSQTVNFVDVGIKLYVTPTINKDGYVTMKIRPEISSSTRTDITSEGQVTQVPIVTTSESETTIMVKDGSTIIIAGLKKDKREKEVKKLPLIGDIPLVGFLFRNTKDAVTKNELVIFITPKIVTGDSPLDYSSLTKDKDIERIQRQANQDHIAGRIESLAGTSTEHGVDRYTRMVYEKIKKVAAELAPATKTIKGQVRVAFKVNQSGVLVEEPAIVNSTNTLLNEYALRTVKQAAPFEAIPNEKEATRSDFNITLEYK